MSLFGQAIYKLFPHVAIGTRISAIRALADTEIVTMAALSKSTAIKNTTTAIIDYEILSSGTRFLENQFLSNQRKSMLILVLRPLDPTKH